VDRAQQSRQRNWDDIERFYTAEAEEPGLRPTGRRRRDVRGVDDLPGAVVAGAWSAIMLILFGALVAGLVVGVATALSWSLWRYWPVLRGQFPRRRRPSARDRQGAVRRLLTAVSRTPQSRGPRKPSG
jgi:hypothetical protein